MIRALISISEDVLIGSIIEDGKGFRIRGVTLEGSSSDTKLEKGPAYPTFEEACHEVYRVVKDARILQTEV